MNLSQILAGNQDRKSLQKKIKYSNVKKAQMLALAFKSNGALITTATNQIIKGQDNKFSLHAEEHLLRKLRKIKAKERFGPIIILVMRYTSANGWRMAKPCKSCHKQLITYGVVAILFTNNDGSITPCGKQ